MQIRKIVEKAVRDVELTDVHTHLYTPRCFEHLLLWGIDELLTYHYLVAETLRWIDLPFADFWALPKPKQAELVWRTLFVDNTPVSEACRGILTVLALLGIEPNLKAARAWFAKRKRLEYVDLVFDKTGVKEVVMTNDPFDDQERRVWLDGYKSDSRFKAALRVDPLLMAWERSAPRLKEWGFQVEPELTTATCAEIRRFLREWMNRMEALYLAVSLPPAFDFPEDSPRATVIRECVLPVCEEFNAPFAMMIGVKKLANPELKLAGDSVGRSKIEPVERLCAGYQKNKFLVTYLGRENQHELCVAARKFRNLMVFGCWWFMNNPVLIEEMTRMRVQLLGTSFIPQHSDARVLDQLVYKWDHSRRLLASVLADEYEKTARAGWRVDEKQVRRDVEKLFSSNFWTFLKRKL